MAKKKNKGNSTDALSNWFADFDPIKQMQDQVDYGKLQKKGSSMSIGGGQTVGYQPPKLTKRQQEKGISYTMTGQQSFYRPPGGAGDGNKGGPGAGTSYVPIWSKMRISPPVSATQAPAPEQQQATTQLESTYNPTVGDFPEDPMGSDPMGSPVAAPMSPYDVSTGITGYKTATSNLERKGLKAKGTSNLRIRSTAPGVGINTA